MKKTLSLLLVLVLALTTIMTACTTGEKSPDAAASASPDSAVQATPATENPPAAQSPATVDKSSFKGKVEVVLPAGTWIKQLREFVKPYFEKEYPNLKLSLTQEGNWDQFLARIASNDMPNMYAAPMGSALPTLQKTGKLVCISDIPDAGELLSKVDPVFIKKIQGKVYCVPWCATTQMMIWNKDLFKEAGLDPEKPPVTWDEFLKDAEIISKLPKRADGSDVYGTYLWNDSLTWGSWAWVLWAPFYYNFNEGKSQLYNEDGTDIVFDKPESKFKDFLEFMKKAQQFAPKDTAGKSFLNRNVGIWVPYGYGWKDTIANSAKDRPMIIGEDVGVAPVPVAAAGAQSWSTLDGRNLMIFNKSDSDAKNTWELAKYLMQDDVNLSSCQGNNQLPTLVSLKDDPYFSKPGEKEFAEQIKFALPMESFTSTDAVQNALLAAYKECVIDEKVSVDEMITKLAAQARQLIKDSSK